ncbi:MAG: methyltransferase [Aurantimonas endophytica]|uniref:Putative nicotinamide N-methyase n=1 Tax=Aurantimonas endophytica TaxID=1522175 RepID=A0A7W6HEL5_9HYPH|nr:methyltransferase [Aurantimonas endophytica]MBB4003794.1 putative nicotinamide N-methyase [Aurantimonas endophytica]MCO6404648.1 methyltransferase [Aurantimonas endophytica]
MKRDDFIRANTSVLSPPHVPELRLHLADEAHGLWQKTETELDAIGLPPPFWAFAWAGGQGLARHVLDHPEIVAGRTVVDFASGSGLVAIAAALAGARSVTAVDTDPFCGDAIRLNAALNGVGIDFDGTDWIGSRVREELLLAGDVFFDCELAERLTPWFDDLVRDGVTVLVGDPGRSYLPRDRLDHLATYTVPVTRALEDAEIKQVAVWQWRPA